MSFGFAHIPSNPFYLYQGTLYKVPTSEKEHGLFRIDMATIPSTEVESTSRPLHPKGGHNYYAGRDMEKLQRRLRAIAKDVAKAAHKLADTEQPHRRDSEPRTSIQNETRIPDFLQRRHSYTGPRQVSYNNLNPVSSSKEPEQTTSVGRHPRDSAITSHATAPFSASGVNADRNPITGADAASAELAKSASPETSSLASMPVKESGPLPSRGQVQTDPPWVALYLARERAEDQFWGEKPTRSVWGTLRALVGFGDAASSNKSKQSGDSVMGKSQTA